MGFLDDLTDDPPALVPEVVRPLALRTPEADKGMELLRQAEERILGETMKVIEGAMAGSKIGDDTEEPPPEWTALYGSEAEAKRTFRIARDARRPSADAPVYLGIAKSVMVGIAKARAGVPKEPALLQVQILVAAPKKAYPVLDLEPSEE